MLLFRGTTAWRLAAGTLDAAGAALQLPASMANASGEGHLGDAAGVGHVAVARLSSGPMYLLVSDAAAREISRPTRWDWPDGRVPGLQLAVGVEPDTATVFVEKPWGFPLRDTVRVRQGNAAHAVALSLPVGRASANARLPSLRPRVPVAMEVERDWVIIAHSRAVSREPMKGFDGAVFQIQMKSDSRFPPTNRAAQLPAPADADDRLAFWWAVF